eukprot:1160274-Pelagomonas_calceolata.AAC.7
MPAFPNLPCMGRGAVCGACLVQRACVTSICSMRDTIRKEEEAIREAHRLAFDEMVERARLAPPQPHDPMRFRAVPPGESSLFVSGREMLEHCLLAKLLMRTPHSE